MEYNIKNIEHIDGKSNVVADYLSRFSLGANEELSPTIVCTLDCEMAGATPPTYQYFKTKSLKPKNDTLIVVSSNARNIADYEIVPELNSYKSILDDFYRKDRQEI